MNICSHPVELTVKIRRALVVIVLALSMSVAGLVHAPSVAALGSTQLTIHAVDSDQYLYTQLHLPAVSLADVQSALPLVSMTVAGQPMMIQSLTEEAPGIWGMEVSGLTEVMVGDNFLGISVAGPTPVYAGMNIVVVERSASQQWPVCDAWAAAWQGPHGTACVMALETPVVIPPVDPEEPEPADPEPAEPEPTVQPAPVASPAELPSYTVASPLALAETLPTDTIPEKKPEAHRAAPSVLGSSEATQLVATPSTQSFELTPVTATVSVMAGLSVAGVAAFVADKLGLIKPKL